MSCAGLNALINGDKKITAKIPTQYYVRFSTKLLFDLPVFDNS